MIVRVVRLVAVWLRRDPWGIALVALSVTLGLVIGLALGWLVWPVQWTTDGLVVVDGRLYVVMAADVVAFDHNISRAQQAVAADGARVAVCQALADGWVEGAPRARLAALALLTGVTCK